MDALQAVYIKIVAAGGDLDAATELKLQKAEVSVENSPSIILHETSEGPLPADRSEDGNLYKIAGVLADADNDILVMLRGGTNTVNVYTKNQEYRGLPKYDIRLALPRASDGLHVLEDYTNMQHTGPVNRTMAQGTRTYLPFEFEGTSDTVFTRDDSAS